MNLLFHWLVATVVVIVGAYVTPGVELRGFFAAFVTAVMLGVVNTFIKPLLLLLTLPINVLTLGLFTLVINALLILLVSAIVPGFRVNGFGWAIVFSIVLTLVNIVFGMVVKK